MFHMKEQGRKATNKMDISNSPAKEFEIMVITVLTKLGRIKKHGENFNNELENIKKNQTKLKTTVTKMNTHTHKQTKKINIRLGNTEKQISDYEDRVLEITQPEQQKDAD